MSEIPAADQCDSGICLLATRLPVPNTAEAGRQPSLSLERNPAVEAVAAIPSDSEVCLPTSRLVVFYTAILVSSRARYLPIAAETP